MSAIKLVLIEPAPVSVAATIRWASLKADIASVILCVSLPVNTPPEILEINNQPKSATTTKVAIKVVADTLNCRECRQKFLAAEIDFTDLPCTQRL